MRLACNVIVLCEIGCFIELLDQPEVDDLRHIRGSAPFSDQDHVARLDIAMNQADGVSLQQRRRYLAQDVDDPSTELGTIDPDEVFEIQTLEILHDVIKDAAGCSPVVKNCHGIRMRELTSLPSRTESKSARTGKVSRKFGITLRSWEAVSRNIVCDIHEPLHVVVAVALVVAEGLDACEVLAPATRQMEKWLVDADPESMSGRLM
jgi:hypothetical protein